MAKFRKLTLSLIVALGLIDNQQYCLSKPTPTKDSHIPHHHLFSLDEDEMIIPTHHDKDAKTDKDGKICLDGQSSDSNQNF